MEDVPASARPTFRGLFTTSAGLLAAALLVVELVAGIQTSVTSTITPLAAGDLDGQEQYGLAKAANQVGLFLILPRGAHLASRFGRSYLLLIFTGVAILGAFVAAVAPKMGWYVLGRGITGLASGALATLAMNVVVTSLPKEWRRLVLRVADLVEVLSRLWACDGGQFVHRPSGLRAPYCRFDVTWKISRMQATVAHRLSMTPLPWSSVLSLDPIFRRGSALRARDPDRILESSPVTMYPSLETFDRGWSARPDGAELYWETAGNAKRRPALYRHGRPGGNLGKGGYRCRFDPVKAFHHRVGPA